MEMAAYAMTEKASAGRRHPEAEHPYRGLYQRDRDRIIHARAFRRLEYKTQVFANCEGDFYRTRLTHTLEVMQVSRTLAQALGLNEDLTEAIAFAHDLGHTPFGHAGERALDGLMREHGGFEHNLHGLRVVDRLEERYADFPGLNLTAETREAFVRHHPEDLARPEAAEFARLGGALLECQATIAADEIAYDNHDIDDGLYSEIIREEDLRPLRLWQAAAATVDRREKMSPKMRRAETVRRLIDLLVGDIIATARANLERLRIRTLADVRACREPVIAHSAAMAAQKAELEEFLKERFYRDPRVHCMMVKSQRFLVEIFRAYTADPRMLPRKYWKRVEEEGAERTVADYIAGMTDRFAEQEYQKLFMP